MILKIWQVCEWLAKWLIMLGLMDLRQLRVSRRSNIGFVFYYKPRHTFSRLVIELQLRNGSGYYCKNKTELTRFWPQPQTDRLTSGRTMWNGHILMMFDSSWWLPIVSPLFEPTQFRLAIDDKQLLVARRKWHVLSTLFICHRSTPSGAMAS